MWSTPIFKVRNALALRAAQIRARHALQTAIRMAADNPILVQAIRLAVCEAEIVVTTLIYAERNALSGPGQHA